MSIEILNPEEVELSILEQVTDYTKLVERFGFWPSFHDNEILKITLDRSPNGQEHCAEMTIELVTFDIRKNPKDLERKNTVVSLVFKGLINMDLKSFNYQNAINGIWLWKERNANLRKDTFRAEFGKAFGADGSLECEEVIVKCVQPYEGKLLGIAVDA